LTCSLRRVDAKQRVYIDVGCDGNQDECADCSCGNACHETEVEWLTIEHLKLPLFKLRQLEARLLAKSDRQRSSMQSLFVS
jgi:hypothetical protein